jgi:hypothetical protein
MGTAASKSRSVRAAQARTPRPASVDRQRTDQGADQCGMPNAVDGAQCAPFRLFHYFGTGVEDFKAGLIHPALLVEVSIYDGNVHPTVDCFVKEDEQTVFDW